MMAVVVRVCPVGVVWWLWMGVNGWLAVCVSDAATCVCARSPDEFGDAMPRDASACCLARPTWTPSIESTGSIEG